jgi:hypothetical protein
MKAFFIFFYFFLFCLRLQGQNRIIDSLDLLKTKEKLNNILFKEIPKIDPKETEKVLNLLDEAEKSTNSKLGNYIVFINNYKAGAVYNRIGDIKNTLKYADKAYNTAIEFGDKIGSARALQCKAISYGKRLILDSAEYYLKKSIKIVESNLYYPIIDSTKNKILLSDLKSNLALNYTAQKKFNISIDISFQALELAKKLKNRKTEMLIYSYIAQSYYDLNNYRKAEEFYLKEKEIAEELNYTIGKAFNNIHVGNIHEEYKKYELAYKLKNEALNIFKIENHKDGYLLALNSIFTNFRKRKMFSKCYEIENELLNLYNETKKDKSHIYIELGEVNALDKNISKAEFYFDEAEKILNQSKASKLFFYRKKTILEKQKGNLKTALEFKNKELELSEKKLDTTFANKLSYYETKYETAEKENQIKTQQLQLEKRNLALLGLCFAILIGGGAWFFYKNKQKQKEKELAFELDNLHNNVNKMELQALNQQLNPHEIRTFIQVVSKNVMMQDEKFYNQLMNLWELTNAVINYEEISIDIASEIENLKSFLTFQQEITYPKFEFTITNNLKDDNFKIPRLLIKNLAGNAIKHGLMGIEGKLNIEIFEKNNTVNIYVQDNGKGFETGSTGKGIGISTYENIFKKLNLINKEQAAIEIVNLEKGGLVKVSIPKNYNFKK